MTDHEADDSGGEVSVRPGDHIRVTLAENASTGYLWSPGSIPDGLVLEDATRDLGDDGADVTPGAAATRVFVFAVSGPVTAGELRLDLKRQWEPEYGRSVTVRVTPATG
jgi:hypothetical protein